MYTGAFAFPDSASLEMSQPVLEIPVKPSNKASAAAKAKAAAQPGKAVPAAMAQSPETAVPGLSAGGGKKAAPDQSGAPATLGGRPAARVVPSAWKAKKAKPVVDQPAEASSGQCLPLQRTPATCFKLLSIILYLCNSAQSI